MEQIKFDYYARVEQVVCRILNDLGIPAEQDISGIGSAGWLVCFLEGVRYDVYLHIMRTPHFSDQQVFSGLERASGLRRMEIFVGFISGEARARAKQAYSQHIVLDICNLLHMVREHEELRELLIRVLDFSVEGFLPVAPDERVKVSSKPVSSPLGGTTPAHRPVRDWDSREEKTLIQRLRGWDPKVEKSGDYEKLCCKTLKQLFADDLSLWRDQQSSNDGLFRFDMVCKIKNGNQKDFWQIAERYFNSRYIVFEYKNYTGQVTQKEVYTTVKYLYGKALRGVAIMVSPNGLDEHARKAIRGILRDEGKLILDLTNRELAEMLEGQKQGRVPADYLSDKLDELLIDLEK